MAENLREGVPPGFEEAPYVGEMQGENKVCLHCKLWVCVNGNWGTCCNRGQSHQGKTHMTDGCENWISKHRE
jgi:hypothetical protein